MKSGLLQIAVCVRNFVILFVDLTLDSLDLFKDVNAFIAFIMNSLLQASKITLKILDGSILVHEALFVVAMADLDVIFEATDASLEVVDDLRKELVVSFTGLMVLDLFAVSANYSISGVLPSNDGGLRSIWFSC